MPRLAYLISRYPAISHTFILREVQELRKIGLEIETVSINAPDRDLESLNREEREEALRTFYVKRQSVPAILLAAARTALVSPLGLLSGLVLASRLSGWDLKSWTRRLFYLLEAVVVGNWMLRNSLDHLHVHFATPAATVALLVKRIFGLPFSLTVHGPDEFYNVSEYHLEEKIAAASFLCCIGSYCRSQLMKLSPINEWAKMEIVPLGVTPKAPGRASFARNSKPVILSLGRLVPAKGQAVLLQALSLLRKRGRDFSAVVAGDGPDRARLEQLAGDLNLGGCCRFIGAVDPAGVAGLMAGSALFVLPSFAEGIPVVLMEAMAMGVPCISTTVNGIPELIESGREGVLVPPSDAFALSKAIERMLDNEDARNEMALAAREKIRTKYNLHDNVRRLAEVFSRRLNIELQPR